MIAIMFWSFAAIRRASWCANKEMRSQAGTDEEILTFDVPDAALEQAGSAEQMAFTLFYCTNQSSECGSRD